MLLHQDLIVHRGPHASSVPDGQNPRIEWYFGTETKLEFDFNDLEC